MQGSITGSAAVTPLKIPDDVGGVWIKHFKQLAELPVLPVLPVLPEALEGRHSKAGS